MRGLGTGGAARPRPAYGSSLPVSAWRVFARRGSVPAARTPVPYGRRGTARRREPNTSRGSRFEDLVRAIGFVLEDAAVRGTVNMVAPQHLTNAELTGALARHYRVSLRGRLPG
ncbi:MAG: hypothetical protein ACLR8Y_09225 [Alistipes indistinctus]